MKKNMTLALGSLMFVLTLAAAPHPAAASIDTFLTIRFPDPPDSVQHTPSLATTVLTVLLSIVGH